jgi:hypothetical protein
MLRIKPIIKTNPEWCCHNMSQILSRITNTSKATAQAALMDLFRIKKNKNELDIENTFLLAIKIVQEAVNHNGSLSYNDTNHYGYINNQLLNELLTTCIGQLEILVVHDGCNILVNRKLSNTTIALVLCSIFELIITITICMPQLLFTINLTITIALFCYSIVSYLENTNYSDDSKLLRTFIKCNS